jgi:hypothetical protein
VRSLSFGRGLYDIQVWRDRLQIVPTHEEPERLDGVLGRMNPGAGYTLTMRLLEDGQEHQWQVEADAKGDIAFDLQLAQGMTFSIRPTGR